MFTMNASEIQGQGDAELHFISSFTYSKNLNLRDTEVYLLEEREIACSWYERGL